MLSENNSRDKKILNCQSWERNKKKLNKRKLTEQQFTTIISTDRGIDYVMTCGYKPQGHDQIKNLK